MALSQSPNEAMPASNRSDNALLDFSALPRFQDIKIEEAAATLKSVIADCFEHKSRIEGSSLDLNQGPEASIKFIQEIERLTDHISASWGLISHLMATKNSEALRNAHAEVQPEMVKFRLAFNQSKEIFEKLQQINSSDSWSQLPETYRRIIESQLRSARHSGVMLTGEDQEIFQKLQLELAELSTSFGNQLLDSSKKQKYLYKEKTAVEGLPNSVLEIAAAAAVEEGHSEATAEEGPWILTTDTSFFIPLMQYCDNRETREKMYREYIQKASSGDLDNTPVISRILVIRKQLASLLGFEHYSDLSLDSKMAPDVPTVQRYLNELLEASKPFGEKEHKELCEFASKKGAPKLEQWDLPYWARIQKSELHSLDDETLRPYFPMTKVLDGLFGLCERLFQVKFVECKDTPCRWHEDVLLYEIHNLTGEKIAYIYVDPFSRPSEKRGGAWVDGCRDRSEILAEAGEKIRLPIAYVVCNQMPPSANGTALMSFGEITTLFHEFGHALQHTLTTVDSALAAGTNNVEWDAVELPSLFMENWCYHKPTLLSLSSHHETGELLPENLIDAIVAARNFHVGRGMLRQVQFGLTDLNLHTEFDPNGSKSCHEFAHEQAIPTSLIPVLPEDRFLCGFAHIFAGSYAAGYYSYNWAAVLSADAFSAFQEAGLDKPDELAKVGLKFRNTILAKGGSRDPMEVFKDFRGREPKTEALLAQCGML